jgi:hypothetical protein
MATIVYANRAAGARHDHAEQVLVRAANAAGRAPVLDRERPWRWHLFGSRAELHLARPRPAHNDAGTARLLVDCGSALHHAVVALRGEGARVRVDRCPDPQRPDLLASICVDGFGPPTPAEVRAHRTIALRAATVARAGPAALPVPAVAAMESAAARAGARLRQLDAGSDDPVAGQTLIEADVDAPLGWLRAGEALSAVALAAAEHGLAVLPNPALIAGGRGHVAVPVELAVADRRSARRTGHRAI